MDEDKKIRYLVKEMFPQLWYHFRLMPDQPVLNSSAHGSITSDLIENLTKFIFMSSYHSKSVYLKYMEKHSLRMSSSTDRYLIYVTFLCCVVNDYVSDIYERFTVILSFVVSATLHFYKNGFEESIMYASKIVIVIFEKLLKESFYKRGGWKRLNGYLLKHNHVKLFDILSNNYTKDAIEAKGANELDEDVEILHPIETMEPSEIEDSPSSLYLSNIILSLKFEELYLCQLLHKSDVTAVHCNKTKQIDVHSMSIPNKNSELKAAGINLKETNLEFSEDHKSTIKNPTSIKKKKKKVSKLKKKSAIAICTDETKEINSTTLSTDNYVDLRTEIQDEENFQTLQCPPPNPNSELKNSDMKLQTESPDDEANNTTENAVTVKRCVENQLKRVDRITTVEELSIDAAGNAKAEIKNQKIPVHDLSSSLVPEDVELEMTGSDELLISEDIAPENTYLTLNMEKIRVENNDIARKTISQEQTVIHETKFKAIDISEISIIQNMSSKLDANNVKLRETNSESLNVGNHEPFRYLEVIKEKDDMNKERTKLERINKISMGETKEVSTMKLPKIEVPDEKKSLPYSPKFKSKTCELNLQITNNESTLQDCIENQQKYIACTQTVEESPAVDQSHDVKSEIMKETKRIECLSPNEILKDVKLETRHSEELSVPKSNESENSYFMFHMDTIWPEKPLKSNIGDTQTLEEIQLNLEALIKIKITLSSMRTKVDQLENILDSLNYE